MSPRIWEVEKDEAERAVCPGCVYMRCWCQCWGIDSASYFKSPGIDARVHHCRTHTNFWPGLGDEQALHVILIYQQIAIFQWLYQCFTSLVNANMNLSFSKFAFSQKCSCCTLEAVHLYTLSSVQVMLRNFKEKKEKNIHNLCWTEICVSRNLQ